MPKNNDNNAAAAQTPRVAGNFLADSFGASVQHVAFACDNILVTAGQLAASGMQALPIGANYYDDLATRSDLDAVLLAQIQTANILYVLIALA